MKKISEKTRRLLRRIYQGLGVSAISFIFQACYGPMMDLGNDTHIYGTVHDKEKETPIQGIKVSVENVALYEKTNDDGDFIISVPKQDSYTIKFEDIDGEDNGLYKSKTKELTRADISETLTVYLCEVDE